MPATRGDLAAWPGRSFADRRTRPGPRHADRLRLAAEPREAWTVARQLLVSWPRVRLEDEAPGYLRFSERGRWLGRVDDLELALDLEAGAIDVRSESRGGVWDLGANRRRVRLLRRRLTSFGIVEPR